MVLYTCSLCIFVSELKGTDKRRLKFAGGGCKTENNMATNNNPSVGSALARSCHHMNCWFFC